MSAMSHSPASTLTSHKTAARVGVDYPAVRKLIAQIMDSQPNYDDGSLGPLFVRLAWHASGSYCGVTGDGGSNGGLIRFAPENTWGGNAGIDKAVAFLEPVKKAHPGITYADLYTLAGVVAVEEMEGPAIKWRPGRIDHLDGKSSPKQDNRLPDATQGCPHLRAVFGRMKFGDREIVALSGAHCLGRCHTDRSGFEGKWVRNPTTFSNLYYRFLLNEKWTPRKWNGPPQFENSESGKDLMMLPSDMALLDDAKMKQWVEAYAKDKALFYKDFADAFAKLLELGVPFSAL